MHSQTKQTLQQSQPVKQPTSKKSSVLNSPKRIIRGTVVVKSDSTNKPLTEVSISIFQDSVNLRSMTDSLGRFAIDISKQYYKLPENITIIVSHPDYQIISVRIKKNDKKAKIISLRNLGVDANKVPLIARSTTESTGFYAMPPKEILHEKKDTTILKKKWWQIFK